MVLIPLSIVIDKPWQLVFSTNSILALFSLVIFSTALAYIIYFYLIQTLGSVGTSSQAYLRVPLGVLISVLIFGEQPKQALIVGLVCVVIGSIAMAAQPKQEDNSR
jgi:drug/metabolite transporter (DMT)-like permease